MTQKRLLETLEQLRAELAQAKQVDPETLTRLEKAIDELRRIQIARSSDANKTEDEAEPVSGLRDLLLKFESEHPQTSAAIGRAADALAAMGF